MSRRLVALERFLALSEAMHDAALGQDWDGLVRLGDERRALDAEFADLAAKLPTSEQAAARRILERCQALDSQIRALTEERQKALRVLLRVPAA